MSELNELYAVLDSAPKCKVSSCSKAAQVRGLCRIHHMQYHRTGAHSDIIDEANIYAKREPNKIFQELGYAEIGLTKEKVTKVSIEDYEELSRYLWSALEGEYQWRAYRTENRKFIYMHREVMRLQGIEVKGEIDHDNRDSLDNRRENLKDVTHLQNMANSKLAGTSRGYVFHKHQNLWRSYVKYPGQKQISIGYSKTEEKAKELTELGKHLQETGICADNFLQEWDKIRPRRKWDREGV